MDADTRKSSETNTRLDAYWMPFTASRDFRQRPRILTDAKGHYYRGEDGRQLYDSFSGLWTNGLGHCHPKIVEAIKTQAERLDHAMAFQASNDQPFFLADRLSALAPDGFGSVFFTNSGSEAADTALKIALAYHKARGDGARTRLVGRERAYHGVNFGGMSVGGIVHNRRAFSATLLPGVDHLPHTHDPDHTAFTKGQPRQGAHLADALEGLCNLHGGENIAAVIVEPVAGSSGIFPPPIGYLRRLREICTRHGILLIFDEVITAFGRVGQPFAAHRFDVTPDIITTAKGLTNGSVPMGAVIVRDDIRQAFDQGPEHMIELFHGYTYSGHPLAAAAGIAALDVYREDGVFEQARALEPIFEEALHGLADHPKVIDVRNFGLMGAVELSSHADGLGKRGLDVHKRCFWDEGLVVRNGGDTLQFAPFLNAAPDDIHATFQAVRRVLDKVA